MAQEVILAELTFTSALDETYGYCYSPDGQYELIVGETYRAVVDGVEYTCIAQDASALPGMEGGVFIGNAEPVGLVGNGEPFGVGGINGGLLIAFWNDTEPTSHTIAIYTAEKVGIVLKDRDGNDVTHATNTVRLKMSDGETQEFVNAETVAQGVETIIEPDFSVGDMEVVPDDGTQFSKVIVNRPAGLVPANIPEGMYIAGVGPGEFEGGGGVSLKEVAERTLSGVLVDDTIAQIGSYAFFNTEITGVSIPNCAKVGIMAFCNCSLLTEANLSGCLSIYQSAFSGCTALETVVLGCNSNFFTTITPYAFCSCSALSEIKFMYSGSFVDGALYCHNSQGTATYTFHNCSNLKSIHLVGKGSTYGGSSANGCAIGSYTFQNCYNLSEVKITGVITAYRYSDTTIQSALGAYDIGAYAFAGCSELRSLSLTVFGNYGLFFSNYAFSGCSKLQDLWLNFVNIPTGSSSKAFGLGTSVFYGTPMSSSGLTGTFGTIHVTKNAYPYLRVASGWSAYAARMVSY